MTTQTLVRVLDGSQEQERSMRDGFTSQRYTLTDIG